MVRPSRWVDRAKPAASSTPFTGAIRYQDLHDHHRSLCTRPPDRHGRHRRRGDPRARRHHRSCQWRRPVDAARRRRRRVRHGLRRHATAWPQLRATHSAPVGPPASMPSRTRAAMGAWHPVRATAQPRPDRRPMGRDRPGRARHARQNRHPVPYPQEARRLPPAELARGSLARGRAHQAHALYPALVPGPRPAPPRHRRTKQRGGATPWSE